MNTELARLRQIAVQRGDDVALADAADSIVKLRARCEQLIAALTATLATLEEAASLIVADPGHSIGLAAQMEMVIRKAKATVVKSDR